MKRRTHLRHDIPDEGHPTNSLGYFSAHYASSLDEIEKFGVDHFDKLNEEIRKDIPEGELAGTHHGRRVDVSSRIPRKPKWERKEIELHECHERDYMGF